MSDEEKKAMKDLKEISHYCSLRAIDIEDKYSDTWAEYVVSIQKVFNLIEKQSKEIEELKEDKYGLEEEVQIQAKQLIEIDGNYISKEESEQKEKQAYIDGANATDELCNKKWERKIKAKIEELEKQDREDRMSHNYLVIPVLQSLLEKE